jgi:hypothetical protein
MMHLGLAAWAKFSHGPTKNHNLNRDKTTKSACIAVCPLALHCSNPLRVLRGDFSRFSRTFSAMVTLCKGAGNNEI